MLSILSGHRRYAHVTSIRCDGVNPGLLWMDKVISEDLLRRALLTIGESAEVGWLDTHLRQSTAALLDAPWILDIDTTIKLLYGKQEGAQRLPGLLELLDDLPAAQRPRIVRGDCGFGSGTIMHEAQSRDQPYLFKLRLSKNVKRHIERIFTQSGCTDAGQGWEGMAAELALSGWET